jgi:hypothetical protein
VPEVPNKDLSNRALLFGGIAGNMPSANEANDQTRIPTLP